MKILQQGFMIGLLVLLQACSDGKPVNTESGEQIETSSTAVETDALAQVLAQRSDEDKSRDSSRHPRATLEFMGLQPGMTVVEVLPGGGWYSKILLPYLGKDGQLVGVDYPQTLWPNFSWMTPERIEAKKTWVSTWTAQAQEWRGDNAASVNAFQFEEMPAALKESADAVLFIRALHNLARFSDKHDFLGNALKDTYAVLKPGGIVGIVQHQAREDRPDSWANGDNGYLKKSAVIALMQNAGFEFIAESNINENPLDQANVGDIVWRLPPSFSGSGDDATKKAAMTAIGESHRMTLTFRKPK